MKFSTFEDLEESRRKGSESPGDERASLPRDEAVGAGLTSAATTGRAAEARKSAVRANWMRGELVRRFTSAATLDGALSIALGTMKRRKRRVPSSTAATGFGETAGRRRSIGVIEVANEHFMEGLVTEPDGFTWIRVVRVLGGVIVRAAANQPRSGGQALGLGQPVEMLPLEIIVWHRQEHLFLAIGINGFVRKP